MTREGGSYRWWLLLLLGGAYFFHQADRAIFGVLTPYIAGDLNLSKPEIGRINQILSWTIALVTFFAGFVGDRFSRKWVITLSLMFWSLATAAMGLAGDWRIGGVAVSAYLVVVFLRSLATGGGESFYGPASMSLIASYHEKTRSLAFSINQAFLYIGLMLSGVLALKTFNLLGGWRPVFIVFGVSGFLLGVFFIFLLKDPGSAPSARRAAAPDTPSPLAALKSYFLNPSALLATCGFVAIVCVNNAYLFWAPTIFHERFGVEATEAGAHAMFYHHLAAFAAILAGGSITDRFVSRFPRFRLGLQISSLLVGAPVLYFIGRSSGFGFAVAMTAAYGIFRGLFEANTHASVFDVVPANCRASVVGFMLLIAFFVGGWFSGDFMGSLLERAGERGFELAFAVMGGVYALAALLMSISFFFTFRSARCKLNSM